RAAATRPTAGAAPVGDAVEPGGLLAGCGGPLGGLDGGPADQSGALFGDRAAAHGGVGLAVTRGVSPAQEHSCGAPVNRWTSPISATKTAARPAPPPGMPWMPR